MKVLVTVHGFLTPSMTFVYNQISAMRADGHTVKVIACQRMNCKLFPYEELTVINEGKHFTTYFSKIINRLRIGYSLYSAPFARKFRQSVAEFKPDVIHVHFGLQLIRIYPAVKDIRIPVLTTFHGIDASKFLRNRRYCGKLKKIFQSDFFWGTAVSQDMKKRLINASGIHESSLIVDYLGIDVEFFKRKKYHQTKDNEFIFLQVSNFIEKKGHKHTINAFSKYIQRFQDHSSKLILAGEGPLLKESKKQVESLGLNDRIHFIGLVDKYGVRDLMEQADFFVHHSITASDGDMEGLPTVIMEALAMDLPVLSTFHSGIPEIVTNGKNGILIEEGDEDKYADMMSEIQKLQGMDTRTLILKKFNLDRNTSNILDIINEIIQKNKNL